MNSLQKIQWLLANKNQNQKLCRLLCKTNVFEFDDNFQQDADDHVNNENFCRLGNIFGVRSNLLEEIRKVEC